MAIIGIARVANHPIAIPATLAASPVLAHKVVVLIWLPVIDNLESVTIPGVSMQGVDHGPKIFIMALIVSRTIRTASDKHVCVLLITWSV